MKRFFTSGKTAFLTLVLITLSLIFSVQAAKMPPELVEQIQAKYPDGLPRYMTPEEQQWLDQQASLKSIETFGIESLGEAGLLYIVPPDATEPPAGAIWAPPEYSSLGGILVRWTVGTSYDTALRGLVAQASQSTYVWCFVENSTEQSAATTAFTNAGANMSNVIFIICDLDSIWIRDYGPRYFFENNDHAIMDHIYNRPARPKDDGLPEWLANYWSDPYYDFSLTHGGGNFHCFANGEAFVSTLILDENPGYSEQDIKDIFRDYLNVDLTIYPRLVPNIDATGHIDMWFLPLGDNKVLISEFPTSGYPLSRATTENAAADMTARGYTVYRTPAWNSTGEGSSGGTHYTYTNSVIVNGSSKRVIIPSFSGFASQNSAAFATFQSALPDYTVVQVDCTNIIPLAGAVHCIMKHVYPATTPIPTIKVLSANGGEWWKVGTQQQIEWVASDDVSVASVNLYYSTNNGSSWNPIATGLVNTGSYDWTTPLIESAECLIRAVVYDGDSNTREDLSNKVFTISFSDPPPPPIETVYTFSGITNPSGSHKAQDGEIDVADSVIQNGTFPARQGTAISGWAYWAEATTAEYAALVNSDDSRYSSADPGYGDNAAMLFEFYVDEDPEDVVQIDVSLEMSRYASTDLGYAYLWNYSASSYLVLGTHSGTADSVISASITSNPSDYINPTTGQVTVFVVNMDDSDLIRVDQINVTVYEQASPVMQTLSVSSTSGGSVTMPGEGDFQYVQGTDANIAAVPDLNYHFVNWTGNGVDAGKVADSNSAGTTITMDSDYAVVANFAIDTFNLEYAAGTGGTLTGDTSQIVNYGENGTAVTAVPDVGYHFINWSDDSTDNPRTDLNVTANISVTANFAIDTFNLDYAADFGGTLTGDTSQVVDYGENGTAVTAVPNIGYHFMSWSDYSTENPRTDLNVTADVNVTAIFAIYTFNLNYTAGAGGSLEGDTAQVVTYGSNGTAVTAVPNVGYHFVNWSDASVENPRTDLNVTANINVTANFAIDTFTLDYTAGAGGTLTGETSQIVNYGENGTEVMAVPNVGYHFVNWSDASDENPRTDLDVTANISVTAYFSINQLTIYGCVTEPDANIPVEGVLVEADNGGGSDTTDANGFYQLIVNYGWSGDVEPSKTGYTFEPNIINYSNIAADQNDNYIAILDTFIIYGYTVDSELLTPMEGVLMSPDGDGGPFTSKYYGGADITDANGYYEVLVDYNFTGKVTPSKYAYAFEPNSMDYNDVAADIADQNYAGMLLTYTISGYITNGCDIPIADVIVDANNGGNSDITDANGFYEIWVDYNWSGTITPSKENYTFEPNSTAYVDVLDDIADQDYTATNIYDLNCDGSIGLGDLDLFCDYWLATGIELPADFFTDENNIVNFPDFAMFANVWIE